MTPTSTSLSWTVTEIAPTAEVPTCTGQPVGGTITDSQTSPQECTTSPAYVTITSSEDVHENKV